MLARIGVVILSLALMAPTLVIAAPPIMTVYKSPTCSCCAAWVSYVRDNGFEVIVKEPRDLSGVKRKHGVSPKLASCHTAIIDGYVVEGHVPVEDIQRLLADRPDVLGLTAPGMPQRCTSTGARTSSNWNAGCLPPSGNTSAGSI